MQCIYKIMKKKRECVVFKECCNSIPKHINSWGFPHNLTPPARSSWSTWSLEELKAVLIWCWGGGTLTTRPGCQTARAVRQSRCYLPWPHLAFDRFSSNVALSHLDQEGEFPLKRCITDGLATSASQATPPSIPGHNEVISQEWHSFQPAMHMLGHQADVEEKVIFRLHLRWDMLPSWEGNLCSRYCVSPFVIYP